MATTPKSPSKAEAKKPSRPSTTKAEASKADAPKEQPKAAAAKPVTTEASAAPKTQAEWITALEKLPTDDKNVKYPALTNGQVLRILLYQTERKAFVEGGGDTKADLTPEMGKLLRSAARAAVEDNGLPAFLDTLNAAEKKALVAFEEGELSEQEASRYAEKKGLVGKAKFLWTVTGMDSKAQAAAAPKNKAKSSTTKPRVEKPKRWREGTFVKTVDDPAGALTFYSFGEPLSGAEMVFVGQFKDDDAFYDECEARLKEMKVDTTRADLQIITLRARFSWSSRGPAVKVEDKPEAEVTAPVEDKDAALAAA